MEAFKFRYDAEKLTQLETKMDSITIILYINAVLYYFICIFFPIIFAGGCGHGIDVWSHIIYTIYALINFVFEFLIVVKIQWELDDPNLLTINRWHVSKHSYNILAYHYSGSTDGSDRKS